MANQVTAAILCITFNFFCLSLCCCWEEATAFVGGIQVSFLTLLFS